MYILYDNVTIELFIPQLVKWILCGAVYGQTNINISDRFVVNIAEITLLTALQSTFPMLCITEGIRALFNHLSCAVKINVCTAEFILNKLLGTCRQ